jgi:uncharacterized protein (DUF58 family)
VTSSVPSRFRRSMDGTSTHLTDRAILAFGAIQVAGSLSLLLPWVLPLYVVATVLFAGAMISDRRSLRSTADIRATLMIPRDPELGEEIELSVEVFLVHPARRLRVHHPSLRTVHLQEREVGSSAGTSYFTDTLRGFAIRLGYERISKLRISLGSTRGLWIRRYAIEIAPCSFRVAPIFKRIPPEELIKLLSSQGSVHTGVRQLVRHRGTEQFLTIREYQFPDPISHMDARKSAKFDRLMTRVYDSHRNYHLVIALDVGRAMCGAFAGNSKHDYYLSAVLNLVKDALRYRDTVSFVAFSREVHRTITRTKHFGSFEEVYCGREVVAPREEESNFRVLVPCIASLTGQRSVVIVFTDLSRPSVQQALLDSLPPVCAKHLTAVVGLADRRTDLERIVTQLDAAEFDESRYAQVLYSYWVQEKSTIFREQFRRIGGNTLSVPDDYWLSATERLYGLLRSSVYAG